MTKRNILIVGRLFFGLLTLTAIGIQLSIHISKGYDVVNFLSYFTNLSNIFAAAVFIMSALYLVTHRRPSALDDVIRGASVISMALVGVVFSLLLRNEDLGSLLPWINAVLHYIMPAVVVLDWLYQPPRTRLTAKHVSYWMIFPLLYLGYSVIRGAAVDWYAYPFFNPEKVGGLMSVAAYCLAIMLLFLILGWVLLRLGNKFKRNRV